MDNLHIPVEPEYSQELFDHEALSQMQAEMGDEGMLPEELEFLSQFQYQEKVNTEHYDNLAKFLDRKTLRKIASDVINWVDWDEESREDWEIRESKGIKLLGVSDKTEGGANFDGASRVVHPLLVEAITQFHSRAIVEMWPPEGPVKTKVMGEITPERTEQADRVQDYMNYLYTTSMPGAFEEEDQMLYRLPLSGSCFKKIYYDPLEDSLCSRLVEPSDFIVPYSACDLRTAPRFTHRNREQHNDVLKKIAQNYYHGETLDMPLNEEYDYPRVREEIDHTEGKNRTQIDDDQRHTVLEMYVDLDLEGFEDKDKGKETGIALPYIVTVNRDDQSVLRIQRNWRPKDELKKKRIYFTHYKFTPGYGFYGYGLLHLIGGLTNSATGALRSLLDAAQFANMQGGYKTRDARIKGGDTPIAPGEWREVDSSAEELKKAFFNIPYKEPSMALFNLLGYLDERGQRFVGTTENMVGEASNTAPVGTTLALIEQGSKTFTAIHKRLHEAHSKEFKILAELCSQYIPEDGYPYLSPGKESQIMSTDFDERVDVIPVSDPNIISSTQRITQAQGVYTLAKENPDKMDRDAAIKNMLKNLRVADVEEYMMGEEPDPMQEKMIQLEVAEKQSKLEKTSVEIDKIKAETVGENSTTQYTSMQNAQLAVSMPPILPVADDLLDSAGYVDKNSAPLADMPDDLLTEDELIARQNTDPRFPPQPISPAEGINQGIETPVADGQI